MMWHMPRYTLPQMNQAMLQALSCVLMEVTPLNRLAERTYPSCVLIKISELHLQLEPALFPNFLFVYSTLLLSIL